MQKNPVKLNVSKPYQTKPVFSRHLKDLMVSKYKKFKQHSKDFFKMYSINEKRKYVYHKLSMIVLIDSINIHYILSHELLLVYLHA
jgi:hypothetical protein